MNNHVKKSPLMTLSKRSGMKPLNKILLRVLFGFIALVLCSIVSASLTNHSPIEFFVQLFKGNFGTQRRLWNMLQEMAMLLIIAIAITPAFKMKFWNIGAEGQVLVSGLACCSCMFLLGDKLPYPVLLLLMFVASILAGTIWALIPAIFKALWNTNETLFTLMMNYIAMCLVAFFISVWIKNGSGVIPELQYGHLPKLFGSQFFINIIIVTIVTVLITIYLKKSKHGYELTVVGESVNTARYVGINVKKVIIRTMALSGIICGIAGFILVAGFSHTISTDTVGGRGFTAILVSWLAHFEPLFMVLTSFLVAFINKGSAQMASIAGLGKSYPDIMVGIFFFCIIASEFFINFKINYHKRNKNNKGGEQE